MPRVEVREAPPELRVVRHEELRKNVDVMYVNKHSFELSYQLENVGPSKVKSIEVWWTHGDGKWARYPKEVKPGSHVPITVQADGRYGFTLVPRSGVGLCGKRPTEGDEPNVWVERFHSPSWTEHLRRYHRFTVADREIERRALAFHRGDGPPKVRNLLEHPGELQDAETQEPSTVETTSAWRVT